MKHAALIASLLLPACASVGESDQPELEERQALTFNALTFNALTFNALSANFDGVKAMVDNPLRTESYDGSVPELDGQLSDAVTQEFMHYLVGCALEPGQVVKYEDHLLGGVYDNVWQGELGLCPKWEHGPASLECQQVVSACLLARVNAFGITVPLSMRGHKADGLGRIPLGSTEAADFPWREGAFYGNVFNQAALHPSVNVFVDQNGEVQGRRVVVKGAVYRDMYACWSSVWNLAAAYEKDRICAGGGENCAATAVGACRYHPVAGPTFRCGVNDDPNTGTGDEDYQGCLNTAATRTFKHAITVFLDDPCAMYPDGKGDNCALNARASKYGPDGWDYYDANGQKY